MRRLLRKARRGLSLVHKIRIYRFIASAMIFFFFMASMGAPSTRDFSAQIRPVAIPGSNPQVCIGYNSVKDQWGEEWQSCPAGYAFFGTDTVGPCCPLPSQDILSTEKVEVENSCPDNYVTTGAGAQTCTGNKCTRTMLCTKINTERYQLSDMKPALYWGDGFNGWQGAQHVAWQEIPAGIRYAMGRSDKNHWGPDGCVGYPWGSMLTKKDSGFCSEMYFKQLQFSGIQGDPVKGTPVQMFAECDDVANVYEAKTHHCVKAAG